MLRMVRELIYWFQLSRKYSTNCIIALLHNSVYCCFALLFHYDMPTWNFTQLSSEKAKEKNYYSIIEQDALSDNRMENKMFLSEKNRSKWPPKREFDGQVRDQAGYCPLTRPYFQPCHRRPKHCICTIGINYRLFCPFIIRSQKKERKEKGDKDYDHRRTAIFGQGGR